MYHKPLPPAPLVDFGLVGELAAQHGSLYEMDKKNRGRHRR